MYSASPLVRGAGVGFAVGDAGRRAARLLPAVTSLTFCMHQVDPVASQVGVAPYPYAAVGLTQAAGFPPSAAAYAPGLVGVNPYAAVNPYTGVNPYAIAASPYAAPGVVGLAPSAAVGVDGRLYASPVQTVRTPRLCAAGILPLLESRHDYPSQRIVSDPKYGKIEIDSHRQLHEVTHEQSE